MSDIKSKVKWLIEEYTYEEDRRLYDEIIKQGYEVKILPHDYYSRYGYTHDYSKILANYWYSEDFVVFYGSLSTAKKLYRGTNWVGLYFSYTHFYCKEYLQYIDIKDILNSESVYLPLYEVFRRKRELNYFIRPNDPFKSFPGTILDRDVTKDVFYRKYALTDKNDCDLALISDIKKIYYEARLIVSKLEVISISYYKRNGQEFYKAVPFDNSAIEYKYSLYIYAATIQQKYQLLINQCGGLAVIDVALTDNGWKVVEIGSFNTCGLYEADFANVVSKVSELTYNQSTIE